jgi:hypothetical protein
MSGRQVQLGYEPGLGEHGEMVDRLGHPLVEWLDAGHDDGYYGVRRSYLQKLVAYPDELYAIHIGSAQKLTLFIPWEILGEWVEDLRRTFRGRR